MVTVTATSIKELRRLAGAGMSDCKKALHESDGDISAARDWLRARGAAIAASKAGREVAQGLITILTKEKRGVMVETLAETDFVTSNRVFREFSEQVTQAALSSESDLGNLASLELDGKSVEELRSAATLQTGENIQLGRSCALSAQGTLSSYLHHDGKIGVLADIEGDLDEQQRKQLCMHIASAKPTIRERDEYDQRELERQREAFAAAIADSGKSADVQKKIVAGKLNKYIAEKTLLMQEYVWQDKLTVGKFLSQHKAKVNSFALLFISN